MRKLKTYDARCYDLAELFLSEEPKLNNHFKIDELASLIQDTIESFIAYENDQPDQ